MIAKQKVSVELVNRPVLSILMQVAEIKLKLSDVQQAIERRKKVGEERDRVIQDLKKALSEAKTLRGFLPICSICKNIRDGQGYWSQIEPYLKTHSTAKFSQGTCPVCAKTHYPGFDLYSK